MPTARVNGSRPAAPFKLSSSVLTSQIWSRGFCQDLPRWRLGLRLARTAALLRLPLPARVRARWHITGDAHRAGLVLVQRHGLFFYQHFCQSDCSFTHACVLPSAAPLSPSPSPNTTLPLCPSSHPKYVPNTDLPDSGDVFEQEVMPGDIVLLASDGVFDNLRSEQILQVSACFSSGMRLDSLGCAADASEC